MTCNISRHELLDTRIYPDMQCTGIYKIGLGLNTFSRSAGIL